MARVKRPPVAASLIALILAANLVAAGCGVPGPAASPGIAESPAPSEPSAPVESAPAVAPSEPEATASPEPTATPLAFVDVAIVPVSDFRTQFSATTVAEVSSVLAGTSKRYDAIELVGSDADAILAALGVARPAVAARLVLAADAGQLAKDLAASRKRLGFMRADQVGPSVRALSWGSDALFGVGRVASIAAWPLIAHVPADSAPSATAYDPAAAWTMFAGGDIMLDRGVAKTVKIDGRGVNFPFNGGTADITGHTCCSQFGWKQPVVKRTGNAGVVRALVKGADLAIANFENPAPNKFRWHTSGTVFSADPKLIDGLTNVGIDYVSLGNNHIRDAGANGIIQTIANLEQRGIAWSGAGKNLAEARRPAILEAGGTKVAILGYDTIARYYAASATRAGSAQLTAPVVKADVAAARKAGADLVIVFPHWGTEYDATPFAGQQRLARAAVDAGADIVIGNHAHWAAAMEIYKGKPIWYALGNFVFDQTWSEPTMEGITLELTFVGKDLKQIRMRPHIILDKAQPNFMDPTGDGKVVMGQVFAASKGLLPW
jgi:poly-gamma-glutamate capsule biosynthesis protein CapA/YwtB (metallophosphatase superfamily)